MRRMRCAFPQHVILDQAMDKCYVTTKKRYNEGHDKSLCDESMKFLGFGALYKG
jgi:hypothetical protein